MYRIFIVEDDPTMANAMKEKIESWGNEARIVEHFQNVMTEFTAYDPHLVLMDIMLPFSMDITGVRRSARFRKCRLYSYRQLLII